MKAIHHTTTVKTASNFAAWQRYHGLANRLKFTRQYVVPESTLKMLEQIKNEPGVFFRETKELKPNVKSSLFTSILNSWAISGAFRG